MSALSTMLPLGLHSRSVAFCVLLWCLPGAAFSQNLPDYFPGPSTEGRDPPLSYRLEDVEIGLMRSGCFGTCPSYQVVISGDGQVTYVGRRFVRVEGEQHDAIDKKDVLRLLQSAYDRYFFDMRDSYTGKVFVDEREGTITAGAMRITDVPSQYVWIKLGDYQRVVHRDIGGPTGLLELIDLIDEVSGARRWVE